MFSMFQSIQPIHWTGALRHCWLWLTSASGDLVYRNPNYTAPKPPATTSPDAAAPIDVPDDSTAIYCVHGTADRVSAFSLIANRLVDDLPEKISSMNLVSFDHRAQGVGIEEYARQLVEKIKAAGHKKVILMGHSRGALIAAYVTEYLAKDAGITVEAVFPIGGPFSGSGYALPPLSWLSDSVKQMEISSDFLKSLVDKVRISTVPYFYYAAENDALVPIESAYVSEHKDSLVVLERHGHLSMMSSHKLVAHIRQRLEKISAPVNAAESKKEDNSAQKDDVNKTVEALSLGAVSSEIKEQIDILEKATYLRSPAAKIQVLKQLRLKLEEMREGRRGEDYLEAQSVGGFIAAFMQDGKANNNVKPIDVLNEPLNYPLNFFQGPYAGSRIFIEDVISRYNEIRLPEKLKENKL